MRVWLHRHVWKRTGWRWAYSPSEHMREVGEAVAEEWRKALEP